MSIPNLPAYNVFCYFCSQEQVCVYEKRVGTAAAPTVCKNDGAAISNLSIYRKIVKQNGPLMQINGNTISQVSPNYINFNSQFYNVSDFGSGTSQVLLKVNDNSTASDYLWSSARVNTFVSSSITTVQYKIAISSSDTNPNYLSSSLIASNNIGYNILNRGSDELMQPYVNTSDGVIATNVIWSSQQIANFVNNIFTGSASSYTVKVSANDLVPSYLSSSLISSNNIGFNIVNPGTDEKYQPYVNTSDGIVGTNVIWSSQYINQFVSSSISAGKARIDLYNSSAISLTTAYSDMYRLAARYIDSDNFTMSSDVGVIINYPGTYLVLNKINVALAAGSSANYLLTYQMVFSTDGATYNDIYPGPAIVSQNVSRASGITSYFSSMNSFIYSTNLSNTILKMRTKMSSIAATPTTNPFMTGFSIIEM